MPEIKREDMAEVFSQVLQDVLHRSERAFAAFFCRLTAGHKPGYPRFQGRNRYDSFTYLQLGFRLDGDKLHLSNIGSVRRKPGMPSDDFRPRFAGSLMEYFDYGQ